MRERLSRRYWKAGGAELTGVRSILTAGVFLALLLVPLSCLFDPVDLGSTDDLTNEFDLVWNTVDDHYVCFRSTDIDWGDIYLEYRAMADAAVSQDELLDILFEMLSELQDPGITLDGQPSCTVDVEPNYDVEVLWTYLDPQGFTWVGPSASWGWCMFGNTLYIMIEEWNVLNVDLDEVIEGHPGTVAIIFDVRMNSGDTWGAALGEVCRTFNPETRIGYFTVRREGPSHVDFSELHPRMVSQSTDCFTGPVAVLIGENNMRVSEQFACMVSEIPTVTTIGDTTMRRPDHVGIFNLPADSHFTLPDSTMIRADSTTWVHETGVPPDIFVDATPGDFAAGVDPVLEYALEWAAGGPTPR